MNTVKNFVLLAILGVLVAASLVMVLKAADKSPLDSEEITKLLSDAKIQALDLKTASEQLESLTHRNTSWEHHADVIAKMKVQINATGNLLAKMSGVRSSGSPWQQQAIDQITPLLKELAANTTATIEHLNDNKGRLNTPAYREYVLTNYDLASELSALISDFVDYGKTKAKFETLSRRLEIERQ